MSEDQSDLGVEKQRLHSGEKKGARQHEVVSEMEKNMIQSGAGSIIWTRRDP